MELETKDLREAGGPVSKHSRTQERCLFSDLRGPDDSRPRGNYALTTGNLYFQPTLLDPRAEMEQTAHFLNSGERGITKA